MSSPPGAARQAWPGSCLAEGRGGLDRRQSTRARHGVLQVPYCPAVGTYSARPRCLTFLEHAPHHYPEASVYFILNISYVT
eukprot:2066-Chlamydomonas_euryale.AAC.4